jgi:hypothetical protein
MNVLSTILNDRRKTAHRVAEDALHVVKSEGISDVRTRLFDLVTGGKLPIVKNSYQHPKDAKVTPLHLRRQRWV